MIIGIIAAGFALMGCVAIGVYVWEKRSREARHRAVGAYLARAGFTADPHPRLHTEQVHWLQKRPGGHRRVATLWATMEVNELLVTIAEVHDFVRAGKGHRRRVQTQVAVTCPGHWPPFEVAPQVGWLRALYFPVWYRKSAPIGDPLFDQWYRLVAPNPAKAAALLTPSLREWLAERKGRGWWCVRNGRASCTLERACDGPDIERLAANIVGFVAAASRQAVPT